MRNYVADLPGGTATTTIQMQEKGTIRVLNLSMYAAAAGSVEVSKNPLSQIGTAQPTSDVLYRMRIGATASHVVTNAVLNLAVVPFQNIYIHQTGAANVGEANLLS